MYHIFRARDPAGDEEQKKMKKKVNRDYFSEPFAGCLFALFLLVTGSAIVSVGIIIMWMLS